MSAAGVRPARPVTPTTILAGLLDDLVRRTGTEHCAPGLVTDLRRARDLAAGIDPYVERCTTPASPAMAECERRTREVDWPARSSGTASLEQEMLCGAVEGRFLHFLVRMTGARRVLEVGTFTGYSALAMAEALPPDGELVACELDPGAAALAEECFRASPAGARVELRVGPAADTLAALAGRRFDLVFIDADKPGYRHYLDAVLDGDLLDEDGTVCVDNTLMQGQPWTARPPTATGRAIAEFNRSVADDPRLEQVLIPLRDGLTLIRRAP